VPPSNFSGVLTDSSGKPLTSPVIVTVSLYPEQTGEAALWIESQTVQADDTGPYGDAERAFASGIPA
jgi:hypothetical protein